MLSQWRINQSELDRQQGAHLGGQAGACATGKVAGPRQLPGRDEGLDLGVLEVDFLRTCFPQQPFPGYCFGRPIGRHKNEIGLPSTQSTPLCGQAAGGKENTFRMVCDSECCVRASGLLDTSRRGQKILGKRKIIWLSCQRFVPVCHIQLLPYLLIQKILTSLSKH